MKQKEEKTRKRYAMVVELKKCFNCKGCVVACRAENKVPLPISRNWIDESGVRGRYPFLGMTFEPAACNHCEDPPCERVCPTGATFQSPEGIVLVDNRKCVGCKYCILACPYNARSVNHRDRVIEKCTFCRHRLPEGRIPACVETCMGHARHFGDILDPNSEVSRLLAEKDRFVKKKEAGTRPTFYYVY
jgi:Fe-S-cluster-containing dehydrogenase component